MAVGKDMIIRYLPSGKIDKERGMFVGFVRSINCKKPVEVEFVNHRYRVRCEGGYVEPPKYEVYHVEYSRKRQMITYEGVVYMFRTDEWGLVDAEFEQARPFVAMHIDLKPSTQKVFEVAKKNEDAVRYWIDRVYRRAVGIGTGVGRGAETVEGDVIKVVDYHIERGYPVIIVV